MSTNDRSAGSRAGRRKVGNDDVLVQEIAAGSSVEYSARQAGMSAKTAQRRLQDPAIVARINEVRDERVRLLSASLDVVAATSIRLLAQVVSDTDVQRGNSGVPLSLRVRVALDVVSKSLAYGTRSRAGDRITALEAEVDRLQVVGGDWA